MEGGAVALDWAGGTAAGASSEAVVVVLGAAGGGAGTIWLAGVGNGRGGVVEAGFVCAQTEVSAARHSATEQRGRSTRFM